MSTNKAAPTREDVTQAEKAVVAAVISMYHTTRLSSADPVPHVMGKAPVKAAFARLAHTARPDAPWHTDLGSLLEAQRIARAAYRSIEIERDRNTHIPGSPYGVALSALNSTLAAVDQLIQGTARPDAGDGTWGPVTEWEMINRLRDEEADSVTVLCDNPEGPPNNAVECCGFWTGFAVRRFEGATIREALTAAVAAKDEAAKVGYPPMCVPDAGDEDVERVARAIALFEFPEIGAMPSVIDPPFRWNYFGKEYRERCLGKARAALAAMREGVDRGMVEVPREPTDAMRAAVDALAERVNAQFDISPDDIWRTMIEAAAPLQGRPARVILQDEPDGFHTGEKPCDS